MVFACSVFIGLLSALAYRALRHGTIRPTAGERRVEVWSKMAFFACPIGLGVWVALTLVERFPD